MMLFSTPWLLVVNDEGLIAYALAFVNRYFIYDEAQLESPSLSYGKGAQSRILDFQ